MQAKCESKQSYLKQLLLRINFLSPIQQIKENKMYLLQMEDKLQQQIQKIIDSNKKEISIFAARLNGLSPLEKLQQGYAVVTTMDDKLIHGNEDTQVGDNIKIQMLSSEITASIINQIEVRRSLDE